MNFSLATDRDFPRAVIFAYEVVKFSSVFVSDEIVLP